MSIAERKMMISAENQKHIFGQFDAFAKIIERSLGVTIITRDDEVKIIGDTERIMRAEEVLGKLAGSAQRGEEISEQKVNYILALAVDQQDY